MRHWVAIPNFVDTDRFRPGSERERTVARERWGIPPSAFVVGCVAALKFGHKRLDYLIREVVRMGVSQRHREHGVDVFLLLAGATTEETGQVERLAAETLSGRHRIMRDMPRSEMPDLYGCMDVFVLPSLFEMMPISVLEAMASGIPVLLHTHPNLAWMIGEEGGRWKVEGGGKSDGSGQEAEGGRRGAGGICVDMAKDGALADELRRLTPESMRELGAAARQRAEAAFSRNVVVRQYIEYYRRVMGR